MYTQLSLFSPASPYHLLILRFGTTSPSRLVRAGRLLTRLELIEIPSANRQAALVLIHACLEVIDLTLTHLWRLIGLIHGILAVLLLGYWLISRSCSLPSAKEASESVTDA